VSPRQFVLEDTIPHFKMSLFSRIEDEPIKPFSTIDGNDSNTYFARRESFAIHGSTLHRIAQKYMLLGDLQRTHPTTVAYILFGSQSREERFGKEIPLLQCFQSLSSALIDFLIHSVYDEEEIDVVEQIQKNTDFAKEAVAAMYHDDAVSVVYCSQPSSEPLRDEASAMEDNMVKDGSSVKSQIPVPKSSGSEFLGFVQFFLHGNSLVEICHMGVNKNHRWLSIGRLLFFLVESICSYPCSSIMSNINMVVRVPKNEDEGKEDDSFRTYKRFLRCLYFFRKLSH
jgi:hypothetical protein